VAQKFFMFSQISQLSLLRHRRQMLFFKNNLAAAQKLFGYIMETKIGRAIHAST